METENHHNIVRWIDHYIGLIGDSNGLSLSTLEKSQHFQIIGFRRVSQNDFDMSFDIRKILLY